MNYFHFVFFIFYIQLLFRSKICKNHHEWMCNVTGMIRNWFTFIQWKMQWKWVRENNLLSMQRLGNGVMIKFHKKKLLWYGILFLLHDVRPWLLGERKCFASEISSLSIHIPHWKCLCWNLLGFSLTSKIIHAFMFYLLWISFDLKGVLTDIIHFCVKF